MAKQADKRLYESLAAFRYTLRRFLRAAEESARAAGLTPQQYQLLLAVMGQPERDWTSITELAEALQVRHHAAVQVVQRCARAGLVKRSPDPDDRRLVRVTLAPKGETLLLALAHRNRDELSALCEALQGMFPAEEGCPDPAERTGATEPARGKRPPILKAIPGLRLLSVTLCASSLALGIVPPG